MFRRAVWAGLTLGLLLEMAACSKPEAAFAQVELGNSDHYRIETEAATYFYDRSGGGFSRILDREGNDWIGFSPDEEEGYPASAATAYRGIANLVFGDEDNGAGHPGFSLCVSEQQGDNSIRTTSVSGKWQWTVRFFSDHATLTVDKVDPERKYWFLYEGPIAGAFRPGSQYWATDQNRWSKAWPDHYKGEQERGFWRWAAFRDESVGRVFYVAQEKPDEVVDSVSYLGNSVQGLDSEDGMVVFGFGREEARPLLGEQGHRFVFGFLETRDAKAATYEIVSSRIEAVLQGLVPDL